MKKQILVVDDKQQIRKMLANRLQNFSYDVILAEGGKQAIDIIKNQKIDLVLLDQFMPEMDGIETFEKLKEITNQHLPVIMLSAHGSIKLVLSFLKAGGFDFEEKPIDFDILQIKIERALKAAQILEKEIDQRKNAEALLEKSYSELEQKVEDRTNKLTQLNKNLRKQITEKNKAEEELRRSENHYRALFEYSPTPIWEEDFSEVKKFIDSLKKRRIKNFRTYFEKNKEIVKKCVRMVKIIDVNEYVLELHEASSKAELLEGLQNTFTEDSFMSFKEELIAIAENKLKCEFDAKVKTFSNKEKFIHFKWAVVPGYEDTLEKIFISTTDITERKKYEEELQNYKDHLEKMVEERTVELEAAVKELEAFSYSVSHDLRAPIRHISGFADLLNKNFTDVLPETGKRYLKNITNSTYQMGILIDELLEFSRTSRTELKKDFCNMNSMVTQTIEALKPDIKSGNITWQLTELPKIYGDPNMLKHVWNNLISNAIKFSSGKRKPEIEIGSYKENDEIIFYVKDNGAGFNMRHAKKLFGVFQRLHSADEFEGTGIGLANVHRIIQKHCGRIWASSKPGKGAVFYFSIPNLEENKVS